MKHTCTNKTIIFPDRVYQKPAEIIERRFEDCGNRTKFHQCRSLVTRLKRNVGNLARQDAKTLTLVGDTSSHRQLKSLFTLHHMNVLVILILIACRK